MKAHEPWWDYTLSISYTQFIEEEEENKKKLWYRILNILNLFEICMSKCGLCVCVCMFDLSFKK